MKKYIPILFTLLYITACQGAQLPDSPEKEETQIPDLIKSYFKNKSKEDISSLISDIKSKIKGGADINKKDKFGVTAIEYAVGLPNSELVKYCLDEGLSSDEVPIYQKDNTLLHSAILQKSKFNRYNAMHYSQSLEIVKMLLKNSIHSEGCLHLRGGKTTPYELAIKRYKKCTDSLYEKYLIDVAHYFLDNNNFLDDNIFVNEYPLKERISIFIRVIHGNKIAEEVEKILDEKKNDESMIDEISNLESTMWKTILPTMKDKAINIKNRNRYLSYFLKAVEAPLYQNKVLKQKEIKHSNCDEFNESDIDQIDEKSPGLSLETNSKTSSSAMLNLG